MLTNIYYYNFYRPYMIKSVSSANGTPAVKSKDTKTSKSENLSFQLNKARKLDVIKYAKDMTKYIVGLKDSAKNVMRDMEDLEENTYKKGFETAKTWIEEDISEFTEDVNRALDFSDNQPHSQVIKDFAEGTKYIFEDKAEELTELGITRDERGRLSFQKDKFDKLTGGTSQDSLSQAIKNSMDTFQSIYSQTMDILTIPMAEHMQFKNLNYYYNYRLGSIYNDTFKIIETGMIVDAAI